MNETEKTLAQQAEEVILADYPLLAGVEDVADRLAVSKYHLIRCFTKEFGQSPGKFLTETRIEAAATLLATTKHPIDTVAGLVGYSCGNYFSKVFRKLKDTTPQEYRKTNTSQDNDIADKYDTLLGTEFL